MPKREQNTKEVLFRHIILKNKCQNAKKYHFDTDLDIHTKNNTRKIKEWCFIEIAENANYKSI